MKKVVKSDGAMTPPGAWCDAPGGVAVSYFFEISLNTSH
jgi:hypothetical protein